jgi:hypothetical protein
MNRDVNNLIGSKWFCSLIQQEILKPEKLTHLSFISYQIEPEEVEQITTLPNLTHLTLYHSNLQYSQILALMNAPTNQQLLNLKYLNLSFDPMGCATSALFASKLKAFQKLNTLVFMGNLESSQDTIAFIKNLKGLPNLQRLSLGNNTIDSKAIQKIIKNLPQLTSLNVCHAKKLDIHKIRTLINSLPNLVELNISLTDISISEISLVVDELIKQKNFSLFARYVYSNRTSEEQSFLDQQKNRLIEKFHHCKVIFDEPWPFGPYD